MSKRKKSKRRRQRARFKRAGDAQQQLNEISSAQTRARKRKIKVVIDSIEKSKK
jgi:hypothetical protein